MKLTPLITFVTASLCGASLAADLVLASKDTPSAPIIPPHSPTPVRVLTVSGAAGAKAIS